MKILKWIGIVVSLLAIAFSILSFTIGTSPKEGFMSSRMDEIENCFVHRDLSNPEISQVNIAWQLDHILKAIINITQTLEDADPEAYHVNFNFARTIMFSYGDFPRGVAQAPASVIPPEVITDKASTRLM